MKTDPAQTVSNETVEQKQERLHKEHEWRQILQQQFAELWLRLNFPEQSHDKSQKTEVRLEKIRGSGGKAA
jgi:hypothetical protein